MHSTMLLTLLATLPNCLLAFPKESSPIDPSVLFDRAIGSSCSTPYGSGSCQETSSCTTQGFHVPGYCPGDPADVQCCVTKTCSKGSGSGLCMNTDNTCSGKFVTGACPGPSTIQCCTEEKCSTPKGDGVCQLTSTDCSGGSYIAGHCPGPNDLQCCVKNATPAPSGLKSIDISAAQPSKFWSCAAKEGVKKVIVRGYMQSCAVGGEIDSNMVTTYKAAKNAGITNIDAYMFPCTGSTNGKVCKSPSQQVSEFSAAVVDNKIPVKHLWLDIEQTPAPPCNAFELGPAKNLALAKELVAAIKADSKKTGHNWGIYANANTWASMFGSKEADIGASDLPLWAVQDDKVPGVNTVTALMDGWKKAYAKQYYENAQLCGEVVDLDSFTA